jgi:hypothetical protein
MNTPEHRQLNRAQIKMQIAKTKEKAVSLVFAIWFLV